MFIKLKAFIKRKWNIYKNDPDQGFDTFLNWCVDRVLKIKDTNIIISIDKRGYKNKKLIKQFDKFKIKWYVIETQLSK